MAAVGVATAVIVRFEMDADWPSPDEPDPRETIQFVAANAPVPRAKRMPRSMANDRTRRRDLVRGSCFAWAGERPFIVVPPKTATSAQPLPTMVRA